jgi:hypothetical protein
MSLKDKLVTEGMKLAANPHVAKVMQDERLMKLVITAMSVPGRVTTFTAEQKEAFAKTMGLATADEVRDLKRTVASLERELARLSKREPPAESSPKRAPERDERAARPPRDERDQRYEQDGDEDDD